MYIIMQYYNYFIIPSLCNISTHFTLAAYLILGAKFSVGIPELHFNFIKFTFKIVNSHPPNCSKNTYMF